MTSQLNICEVNSLSEEEFEGLFANVIELCTDAAARAWKKRPFTAASELYQVFYKYLDDLSEEGKVTILRLHPDLAGRLAKNGGLTRESAIEQRRAGLVDLTDQQRQLINSLNQKYKSKFGFPFIICARENKLQSIIEGLQHRYNNTREQEIITGINEVKKICRLRILDIVKED